MIYQSLSGDDFKTWLKKYKRHKIDSNLEQTLADISHVLIGKLFSEKVYMPITAAFLYKLSGNKQYPSIKYVLIPFVKIFGLTAFAEARSGDSEKLSKIVQQMAVDVLNANPRVWLSQKLVLNETLRQKYPFAGTGSEIGMCYKHF